MRSRSLTKTKLTALLAVVAALALAAAGCGGGGDNEGSPPPPPSPSESTPTPDSGESEEPAPEPAPEPAEPAPSEPSGEVPITSAYAPKDVVMFLSLNTDLDSEEWTQLQALLAKFPGGSTAVPEVVGSLTRTSDPGSESSSGQGLEALRIFGPELGIAFFNLDGDNAQFVAIAKPTDPAALQAQLSSSDDPPTVKALEDGTYLLAESQALIDQATTGAQAGTLADDAGFQQAMGDLASSTVAKLYANGPALLAAAQAGASGSQAETLSQLTGVLGIGSTDPAAGAAQLTSLALAVQAEDNGIRLDGIARTVGGPEPQTFAAKLPEIVPAGPIAVLDFYNLRATVETFLDLVGQQQPGFDQQLAQIEAALNVTVDNDVLPLLENEHALYVRPGVPIPEITLVLSPEDPTAALATVDKLLAGVGAIAGAQLPFTTGSTAIGSVTARQLNFGQISVFYAAVGDNLVFTSSVAGIADLQSGDRLKDDPAFQAALAAAGVPDETAGWLYVDTPKLLSFVSTIQQLRGEDVDQSQLDALAPIKSLVLYGTGEKDVVRFSGFANVE
ncbi:MAG: DUF3352 domain-containing protein [Thermoleophilia bacterium]